MDTAAEKIKQKWIIFFKDLFKQKNNNSEILISPRLLVFNNEIPQKKIFKIITSIKSSSFFLITNHSGFVWLSQTFEEEICSRITQMIILISILVSNKTRWIYTCLCNVICKIGQTIGQNWVVYPILVFVNERTIAVIDLKGNRQ